MFKPQGDEKPNTDRYLITYADLITLLLGLFVILYASASVDEGKYKEYVAAFNEFFQKNENAKVPAGEGVLDGGQVPVAQPVLPESMTRKSYDQIKTEVEDALADFVRNGKLSIAETSEGIQVTMPEQLLFESAKAQVRGEGGDVLDTLASVLKGVQNDVFVDGHTDADPIRTFQYESNWHLSAARAVNVVYGLVSRGAPENVMVARGFGSQRPIDDNSTENGKAKNRRVEITISKIPSNAASTDGYSELDTIK